MPLVSQHQMVLTSQLYVWNKKCLIGCAMKVMLIFWLTSFLLCLDKHKLTFKEGTSKIDFVCVYRPISSLYLFDHPLVIGL